MLFFVPGELCDPRAEPGPYCIGIICDTILISCVPLEPEHVFLVCGPVIADLGAATVCRTGVPLFSVFLTQSRIRSAAC